MFKASKLHQNPKPRARLRKAVEQGRHEELLANANLYASLAMAA